ncbi:pre-mRNA-splicing factor syf1 [Spiromyces aspiralis]|uniref:Pre-mRNA-splicing factor syf1 n=1 Tax=Spiromyces aspiralis TaxID=68401 RepID=A0ACC1HK43_9FUNG|nr:pre-mRNA-splicing factor syf1 [Spiromyces aspiralis]
MGDLGINDADLPFEKDVLHDKYNLKNWLRYLDHKHASNASADSLIMVYERAVRALPGSYKLWKRYLDYRKRDLTDKNPIRFRQQFESVNFCFERALLLLNKMPRIWLDYLEFLALQPAVTHTRHAFDRALRALPITQHERVWPLYLRFSRRVGGVTAVRVHRRYLQLFPENEETYIDLCIHLGYWAEAAKHLIACLDNPDWVSPHGTSAFQLWVKLADLVVEHPDALAASRGGGEVDAETILQDGIRRYPDMAGRLWTSLARYYIIGGQMERARDIYEEAIERVTTIRDFTQVFDAYAEFEEGIVTSLMEQEAEYAAVAARRGESTANTAFGRESRIEIDLRLERFERLMDRRPFLVNDVLLRQNPNNVKEWQRRAALWRKRGDEARMIEAYEQTVERIQPRKAGPGKLSELWLEYARHYEDEKKDLDGARKVLQRATESNYKSIAELVDVWLAWAEMEIRHDNYDGAIEVLARATAAPAGKNAATVDYRDESVPPQARVFKSLKLWSLYVDLEESVGTLETTRAAYDRIIELRIATPQTIVNYAQFLEERKYFEESFRVYERGIELFGYPVAFELWNIYLAKFTARYGGSKLERARELFEQAIKGCPPNYAKPIYLMYGKLEEEYGQTRHAMRIYELATTRVDKPERLAMYRFYIGKTIEQFGLTATRPIYEKAIETLADSDALVLSRDFAKMEVQLGEIDRARAIYAYASQFADPRLHQDGLWREWNEFEVKHGNEDTFREMLRIKRSVQVKYNTETSFVSAQMALHRQKRQQEQPALPGFTAATRDTGLNAKPLQKEENGDQPQQAAVGGDAATTTNGRAVNPDEVALGDIDDL